MARPLGEFGGGIVEGNVLHVGLDGTVGKGECADEGEGVEVFADIGLVARAADLVGDDPKRIDAQIAGQAGDAPGGVDAAGAGLDDDEHGVDGAGGAAPEVLEPGDHVEDDGLLLAEQEVGDEHAQDGVLGAHASGAGATDGAHLQEVDAPVGDGKARGDVVDARIELEHTAVLARAGAGALLDQVFHLDDGRDLGGEVGWEAEGVGQGGVGVGVDGIDLVPALGEGIGQEAGEGGFADAPFAGDGDLLHVVAPQVIGWGSGPVADPSVLCRLQGRV